jgi:pimeloyl-ACP methyl ester carboxylesterase
LSPYTYYSYAVVYNQLSDTVDGYSRFTQAEADAYSELEYAWGYLRDTHPIDLQPKGAPDAPTLETLQSAFVTYKDPRFVDRGRGGSALIPETWKRLKYTYWLQPTPAPIVYIVPGLGSHRLTEGALALAELVYENGFSAVCVSNPFNYEFIEHASTAAVPAYTPVDAHDLHVALSEVDKSLEMYHPRRLGARALMGYSMGGFQSLYMAAAGNSNSVPNSGPLLQFDRVVAIDTPVRLVYGISKLDEFYQAPLAWPPAERTANIENTLRKLAALSQNALALGTNPPFSGIESKFLIGVTFRLILRDAIFSSQERHNLGVLEHPIRKLRREPLYREIMQFSFQEYFEKFVIPFYETRGLGPNPAQALDRAGDLRTYTAGLQENPNVRLIVNQNDFLLASSDLEWLRATFPPERLTVFPHGGHLGNLASPDVQEAIVKALSGLGAAGPKAQ